MQDIQKPQRGLVAVLAAVITLTLVAGCSSYPPVPTPDEPIAGPALTLEQNQRILSAVNATLELATETLDSTALAGRVTGPALLVRTSQLEVARIRQSTDLVTAIPATYAQVILPTNETWPRVMFAITDPPDPMQPQRLIALVQNSAREPFKLWGWVQLRPGLTMPRFADPLIGSEFLAPDDDSLLLTPFDAVAQYADLLTLSDASTFVNNFEPADQDPFRALLNQIRATQTEQLAAERVEGTYTFTATPTPNMPIWTVRTVDGGAILIASLDAIEIMQAMEGALLSPGTATAQALLQGQEDTNRLEAGFIDMIALYIPPVGSQQRVMLIGYSHVQVSASSAVPDAPQQNNGEEEDTAEG